MQKNTKSPEIADAQAGTEALPIDPKDLAVGKAGRVKNYLRELWGYTKGEIGAAIVPEPHQIANLRLSLAGRPWLWIYGSALAITDFMKEDVVKSPKRYPFYALYLASWASPWPPGVSTAMTIGTLAFAFTRVNNYARRLWQGVGSSFNNADLKENFAHCLEPGYSLPHKLKKWVSAGPVEPNVLSVRVVQLNAYTIGRAGRDSWQMSKHALKAASGRQNNPETEQPSLDL